MIIVLLVRLEGTWEWVSLSCARWKKLASTRVIHQTHQKAKKMGDLMGEKALAILSKK